jgi:hypothetical protein
MDDETIRKIARETVAEVFRTLGVDTKDPLEVQRDFAYVRSSRLASEKIALSVRLALAGTVVSGTLAMLWIGIKAAISGKTGG